MPSKIEGNRDEQANCMMSGQSRETSVHTKAQRWKGVNNLPKNKLQKKIHA